MKKNFFFIAILFINISPVFSQDFVDDLIITTDSASFSLSSNSIDYRRSSYLYFIIDHPEEIVNIRVLSKNHLDSSGIRIKANSTIEIVDSLIKIEDGSYVGSIRFKNIFANPYSRLVLSATINNTLVNRSIDYTHLFSLRCQH